VLPQANNRRHLEATSYKFQLRIGTFLAHFRDSPLPPSRASLNGLFLLQMRWNPLCWPSDSRCAARQALFFPFLVSGGTPVSST
jgi:hypothetical protein